MKQNADFQEDISQAQSTATPLPTPKFLTTTLVCRINVQQNLLIFRIFPSYMSLFGATCLLIVSIKSYLHDYLDLQDFPTEALFFIECMLA